MNQADASTIPQPTYGDLFAAFVAGAKEAKENPTVTTAVMVRSADAYCKTWHLEADPKGFHLFHFGKQPVPGKDPPLPDLPAPEVEYTVYGLYRDLSGYLEWQVHTSRCVDRDDAAAIVREGLDAAEDPGAMWVDFKVVESTTRHRFLQLNVLSDGTDTSDRKDDSD